MSSVRIDARPFGRTLAGDPVLRHDLVAPDGASVAVLDLGATLADVRVPDAAGRLADVVLGYDELAAYERGDAYLGALVGRVAGRIGGAVARLDGQELRFAANDGHNHLHGGPGGFHRRVWASEAATRDDGAAEVVLRRTSPDGEEGYPGRLEVEVRYLWTPDHRLGVVMTATTDAPTLVNLTQHAHWNLAGAGRGTTDDHRLEVVADAYLPVGPTMLPTGEVAAVDGTPFDLRRGARVGDVVRSDHRQVLLGRGVDHAFVLGTPDADGLRTAARLEDPASGRTLTVRTDQPGLQVYAGNVFDGRDVGRGGRSYRQGDGIALETQRFPDAPSHPHFPSVVLRPGEGYRSETWFTFGVADA
jgi:aldose 1-epimerase